MPALRRSVVFSAMLVTLFVGRSFADEKVEKKESAGMSAFLRFVDDETGGRLETADVTYRNADGSTVCLVSAIHIGEKNYFEGLNSSFKKYDVVLYELVKPRDAQPPQPGEQPATGSGVTQFQRLLKDTLNLEFQLDVVDYSPANFVHADLDAETFAKMQSERGESLPMIMLQGMMRAMTEPQEKAKAQPGSEDDLKELIRTFTRPDGERQFKRMLAKNMTSIESDAAGMGMLDGSVILTERNKAAVKVLDQTLKQGKKNIAIYYGAAHMPGLQEDLASRGFKPVATEWRRAWDLSVRADQPSAIEQILLEAVDVLMKEAMEPEADGAESRVN